MLLPHPRERGLEILALLLSQKLYNIHRWERGLEILALLLSQKLCK